MLEAFDNYANDVTNGVILNKSIYGVSCEIKCNMTLSDGLS